MSTALLIVDVQPTFCEGGGLGVEGGNAVAEAVAAHVEAADYDHIITTQDWHIDPGDHFSAEPDFVDSWPQHGVAGSDEAELHPALDRVKDAVDAGVKKGQYSAAYSGFEGINDEGTTLDDMLQSRGVTDVDVVGIAFDYCVLATALDASGNGYSVRVLEDLTVGVAPESSEAARVTLIEAGVQLATA
ncbi:MAG: isochorismatase family protein [Acidimicrobiales bacterium]